MAEKEVFLPLLLTLTCSSDPRVCVCLLSVCVCWEEEGGVHGGLLTPDSGSEPGRPAGPVRAALSSFTSIAGTHSS